jgi:hypothetical protein
VNKVGWSNLDTDRVRRSARSELEPQSSFEQEAGV